MFIVTNALLNSDYNTNESPLSCFTNATSYITQNYDTSQCKNVTNMIISPSQAVCNKYGMIYYYHYAYGCAAYPPVNEFFYNGMLSFNYNNTICELAPLDFSSTACLGGTAEGFLNACQFFNLTAFKSAEYTNTINIEATTGVQLNYSYQFIVVNTQLTLNQTHNIFDYNSDFNSNLTFWMDFSNYTSKPEFSLNITVTNPYLYNWISVGPSPCANNPSNTVIKFNPKDVLSATVITATAVPTPIEAYFIILARNGGGVVNQGQITVSPTRVPIVPFSNIFTQWWFYVMVGVLIATIAGTLFAYWLAGRNRDDYSTIN